MSGHKDLGRAYLERSRPDLAEPELKRALAQDPNDAEALTLLGHALLDLKRPKEAREFGEQALGAAPEDADPHLLLARVGLALERAKQAEVHARDALALEPGDPRAHQLLGWSLAAQRKWRDALAAAAAGLELDPEDEGCNNLRARALIQLGEAREADFALETVLRRNPDDPKTHDSLGWAALHRGDHQTALRHYREALRLDPTSDSARAGLVEALKARNLVYRTCLRFFLWLTRLPSEKVFLVMIGSVFARGFLRRFATSNPDLAPLLWSLYWGILGFILLTWVAGPFFNLLLRFDRDGRHALDRTQVRQANWFAGWLVGIGVVAAVWATGGALSGMAVAVMAMLLLPVSHASGVDGRRARLTVGVTAALVLAGGFASFEHARWRAERERLEPTLRIVYPEELLESQVELSEAKVKALVGVEWSAERQAAFDMIADDLVKLDARRRRADTSFTLFLLGWVAFSWFAGGLTGGTR